MESLIEHLVRLQAVELDRARVAQELCALPGEIARAQTALDAAQKISANASAALSREEDLRNKLERELENHRQKAARFRTQLDSVKTPAQAAAIEHELRFAGSEIERIEDEEFGSLERTEALETELGKAREQVELLAAALETVERDIAARKRELEAALAELDQERQGVRRETEPDWLERFDRLAAARGTGIARAENQQCTGCRMGLRPQTWNQLREGQLLSCDSCSRLLYWDPTITPQPKPPEPELFPGQGRALRKSSQAGL